MLELKIQLNVYKNKGVGWGQYMAVYIVFNAYINTAERAVAGRTMARLGKGEGASTFMREQI